MGEHWLYEWIDEFGVKDYSDVKRVMRLPGPVSRLYEVASSAPGVAEGVEPSGKSILAGSTMDFSGRLSCNATECLNRQVTRLFGRVWHYFDTIVVDGPDAEWYVNGFKDVPAHDRFDFHYQIGQDVEFLVHLRELGVTEHLDFRPKVHFCPHHVEEGARELGQSQLLDPSFRDELARRLKREAKFAIFPDGNRWRYTIEHQLFPEALSGALKPGSKRRQAKKPTKRQVSEHVIARSVNALIGDLATGSRLELPGAAEYLHLNATPMRDSSDARIAQVALNLPLPVMRGMSSKEVIGLRNDLRPHFDRFQYALTEAIREQLQRDPDRNDSKVALAVQNEFIRPAFADIERGLLESKKSFSVKFGASVAVGTTVVTVGLLSSVPLVIGAGVATALGTTLSGFQKKRDERKDIRTSDVYFMWQAQQSLTDHIDRH